MFKIKGDFKETSDLPLALPLPKSWKEQVLSLRAPWGKDLQVLLKEET